VSWIWPALGALVGLIAGSFVGTLVVRWPQGRSLGGRSACDGCERDLAWFDLLPLTHWRCRTCGAPIDRAHPLSEALCAGLGAVAFALAPPNEAAVVSLIGWTLVAAALLDWRHFWLPDVLTAFVAVLASFVAFAVPEPDLLDRLIGAGVGFGLLWLIGAGYARARGREGLGGGDPKLLGAIGLWLGWQALPFVLLAASSLGIAVTLAMMIGGNKVGATTRLPFGTFLALAAFAIWIVTKLKYFSSV